MADNEIKNQATR